MGWRKIDRCGEIGGINILFPRKARQSLPLYYVNVLVHVHVISSKVRSQVSFTVLP